jgi:hypothetical protein
MIRRTLAALFLCVFAMTAAASPVTGKWKASVTLPNGDMVNADIEFKDVDGKLSGTIFVPETGQLPMEELKLAGDELSFRVTADANVYAVKVTVSGDTMKGTFKVGEGSGSITATR